jgi:hypothetical protein
LTALALAEHGDPDGSNIYPSLDTLAVMTEQGRSTIKEHIAEMIRCGWLVVVESGGGRGRSTKYRIPIERIPRDALETGRKLARLPVDNERQKVQKPAGLAKKTSRKRAGNRPKSGVGSTGTSTSTKSNSSTGAPELSTATHESHGRAAAAFNFYFPEKLSALDRRGAVAILNGTPHADAQRLLDELDGRMRDQRKARVDRPLALLARFMQALHEGRLGFNYAEDIQLRRELAAAEREGKERRDREAAEAAKWQAPH